MRYLSVCSGIEAATVAWHGLGWTPAAFSEIENFPSAVLAHHYPTVPNWGDMTNFKEWPHADIDVLVGGTPCQSFSVAGLRQGLADPRGNLMLTYLAIAQRYRPQWVVWENVPGVLSSNGGRDFGTFLAGLAELGYGWAYRVLDAQYFGIPQRRRRVFVVGCLGNWAAAAAVLFERESLSGHPAPSREAGEGVTFSTPRGVDVSVYERHDQDGRVRPINVAPTLHSKSDNTCDLPIVTERQYEVFCPQCDGDGSWLDGDCERCSGTGVVRVEYIPAAFAHQAGGTQTTLGYDPSSHTTPTLARKQTVAVAFYQGEGSQGMGENDNIAPAIKAAASGGARLAAMTAMQVRRLTPKECARLQGFPDTYLDIPYRGKPAADGPKYKALGNSMAVPVMHWIGERVQAVDELMQAGSPHELPLTACQFKRMDAP